MTPYRRKLALAILIWTVGALPLAAAAAQALIVILGPIDGFTAPGSISARLQRGDETAILLQARGSDLGNFENEDVRSSQLDCVARSADGAHTVHARKIDLYNVTRGGDLYLAKVGFTAPSTGRYVVRCDLHGTSVARAPLALSDRAHLVPVVVEFFGALALCAATIMGGVLLMRRARRERDGATRP